MARAAAQGGPDPFAAAAVLPARLGSTRLPRKMLLDDTGLPLFVHSARNAARCPEIARVVVATDSEEIRAAGEAAGVEVLMTSPEHPSGTDRVREAARALSEAGERYEVIVNVQADEPEVDPADLSALVRSFADPAVEAATLCAPIAGSGAEARDPSVVKVVRDARGDALYFSRSPIPSREHARSGVDPAGACLRHVGVYAFRPAALERFCALPLGRLEALENLEQLRWLEAGLSMRMVDARRAPQGIDTRADYDAFVARFADSQRGGANPGPRGHPSPVHRRHA